MMIFENEDDIELVIRKTFTILFFVLSTFVIYIYSGLSTFVVYIYTGLPTFVIYIYTGLPTFETTNRNFYRIYVYLQ